MRIHYESDPWVHPSRPGHPERAHRLAAAYQGLLALPSGQTSWRHIKPIPIAEAVLAHDSDYLMKIAGVAFDKSKSVTLDGGDTEMSETTLDAALRGLGGARSAVDDIMSGPTKTAMLLSRPPGHHAGKSNAEGFCIFGTAAWAALDTINRRGLRVAVLDFDLHHGNGTQEILWDKKDVYFASSHQEGIYPQSGKVFDVGKYQHIYNAPLMSGTGSAEMRERWSLIFKEVSDFAPDLIIVSAGFDAHANDPMSGLGWTLADYEWLGSSIASLAEEVCKGRVLSIFEGGYDLQVVKHAITAYARPLCMTDRASILRSPPPVTVDLWPSPYLSGSVEGVTRTNERYAVRKLNGRMWIEDQKTTALVWTPPDFITLMGRDDLNRVVGSANKKGVISIDDIIDLEAKSPRKIGYNRRRSGDFPL